MRTFHLKRNLEFCPTVNVDRLWSLLPEGVYEQAKAGSEQTPVLDVTKLVNLQQYCREITVHRSVIMQGYFKVLGKGVLPSIPIVVKAKFFSKEAEKKIKAAGGAAILTA